MAAGAPADSLFGRFPTPSPGTTIMKAPLLTTSILFCALALGCTHETASMAKDACCENEAAMAGKDTTAAKTPVDAAAKAKEGEGACAGCAEGEPKADVTDTVAKGITLKEYTSIDALLDEPAKYEDKRVLVKGTAVDVCKKAGCWVQLKSDKNNTRALFVKVTDGEIVFPVAVTGQEVVVEGIFQKLVKKSVDDLRAEAKAKAEAAGTAFDPATITEPQIGWRLRGLGAKWES